MRRMHSLIDTHIHLAAPELTGTGPALLAQARHSGITAFVVPGVRASDWQQLLAFADQQTDVFAAPGLHPAYAEQWGADTENQLRQYCQHPKVIAIGEIGLDGVAGPALKKQERVLRSQLQIAVAANLPVLLHARKATGRLLAILRELQIGTNIGGIWHGFSGSLQTAQELVRLGFKIGVGPIILRESARKLPAAICELPPESLVLETDFPDMAEHPEALRLVAQEVAKLRGWTLEETARITTKNSRALFKITL